MNKWWWRCDNCGTMWPWQNYYDFIPKCHKCGVTDMTRVDINGNLEPLRPDSQLDPTGSDK